MISGASRAARPIFGFAFLAGLATCFLAGFPAAAGEGEAPRGAPPPEPAGYRMEDYRSPTPLTLKGARVVGTPEAEALWRDRRAVFIDTMPRDVKPANLPAGTVWRDRPRDHVPGSAWLANVGYGETSPEITGYFRSSLDALSGGDKARTLLFYCRADCWMSWNAAKRAMEWGYSDVVWYPDGSDGWAEAGLSLEPAKPYELPKNVAP
ncbi:PQQ-dependent catabolism-associated CXXCW motif protein [Methylopila sp. M107]|uniref:PQQ-dependent catabolism-associated CXXCW motif protein n=1 Tax=Methylopila sp. M107 TaxID=1101190 RepID=UPI0003774493|nr:PQQ-dependent catabolism-associated CXXCW motif protein [Methylopila sp. M107]